MRADAVSAHPEPLRIKLKTTGQIQSDPQRIRDTDKEVSQKEPSKITEQRSGRSAKEGRPREKESIAWDFISKLSQTAFAFLP